MRNENNRHADFPGREFTFTREFAAPRELVFTAWTDPNHLAQWWGPKGFTNPVCDWDVRPGGKIYDVMRAPDGAEHPMGGKFLEIVPPEKLVFGSPSSPEQGATLVFTEEGKRTKLTMTIACASKQDRDALLEMRVDAGTARTLENLAAYLPTMRASRAPR